MNSFTMRILRALLKAVVVLVNGMLGNDADDDEDFDDEKKSKA